MSPPLDVWFRAYLATLVIEVPIAAGWLRDQRPVAEGAAVAVLASTLTHPALWYAWPWSHDRAGIAVGEAAVWTTEAGLYVGWLAWRGLCARRALGVGIGVSALANAASTTVGLLLWG